MEKTLDQIMDEYIKASEAFGQSLTDEQRKKPETIAFLTVQVDVIESIVHLRELVLKSVEVITTQSACLRYTGDAVVPGAAEVIEAARWVSK